MEWCVDLGARGAGEAVARDVHRYLIRRGAPSSLGEAAATQALADLGRAFPKERLRLRLLWEGREASLVAYRLLGAEGGLPGLEIAAGATACPWFAGGLLGQFPAAVARVELGVTRALEGSADPDPGGERLPAEREGFLAGIAAMATRLSAYGPIGCSSFAGAASARQAEEGYRDRHRLSGPLSTRQVLEAFTDFQRSVGGDFEILEQHGTQAVVANRTCPFGDAVRQAPHLCRVTSAMLGSLAARSSGRAVVRLDATLSAGDPCCRLSLDAQPLEDPALGHLYTSPPSGLPAEVDEAAVLGRIDGHGISISLQLPRDRLSVPVIRHLARFALTEVGVVEDVAFDIELALSEACTNVLSHSGPGDAYEVGISILSGRCELRITDTGRGFDHVTIREHRAGNDAERGRGMALMQSVMDRVDFVSEPERGTLVTLIKQLVFDESSPARLLLAEARRSLAAES